MGYILDKLFLVVTFFNVTYLFLFLEPFFSITSIIFSFLSILIYFVYIIFYLPITLRFFSNLHVINFLIILLIFPLIISLINTAFYSEIFSIRTFAERLLNFLIFISSMVFITRNYPKKNHYYVVFMLFVLFIGLYISLTFPALFLFTQDSLEVKSILSGRAFGFYLQPNSAALATILLALIYLYILDLKNIKTSNTLILFCFFAIILTASRSGILISLIVFFLYVLYKTKIVSFIDIMKFLNRFGFYTIAIIFSLFSAIFFYTNYTEEVSGFGGAQRLNSIADLDFDQTREFASSGTNERLEIIINYSNAIIQRPIGHGVGVAQSYKEMGFFKHSSHNQYLLIAFESGIFGLLLYILYLLNLFNYLKRTHRTFSVFVVLLFLYGFVINNLFSFRVVFYSFGVILGLCFIKDKKIRRISN